jgi:Transposase IS200 like
MGEYRHSGHAVCDIKYHLVWITKYRYKILRGEVAERARDLIRQICHAREVVIFGDQYRRIIFTCWFRRRLTWLPRSWCST